MEEQNPMKITFSVYMEFLQHLQFPKTVFVLLKKDDSVPVQIV